MLTVSFIRTAIENPGHPPEEIEWDMQSDSCPEIDEYESLISGESSSPESKKSINQRKHQSRYQEQPFHNDRST